MLPQRLPSLAVIGALAAFACNTDACAADAKVDYGELHKLVTGLGYEDTGDKSTYVSVSGQGSAGYSINFMPGADGDYAVVWVVLNDIPKGKASPLAASMLHYNDTHPYAFALSDGAGSVDHAILQTRIPAKTISPVPLREALDGLVAAADETKDLWKEGNWSEAAAAPIANTGKVTPADLAAEQRKVDDLWARIPFGYQHALLVQQPSAGYGMYDTRASNDFSAGEKIHSYVEPLGYTFKTGDAGKLQFGVVVDFKIVGKGGTVLTGKDNFLDQTYTSHEAVHELCLDLALTMTGAEPGPYTIVYTLHDKFGDGRITSFEQPVVIKAATSAD